MAEAKGGGAKEGARLSRFWQISWPYLNQAGADYVHQLLR